MKKRFSQIAISTVLAGTLSFGAGANYILADTTGTTTTTTQTESTTAPAPTASPTTTETTTTETTTTEAPAPTAAPTASPEATPTATTAPSATPSATPTATPAPATTVTATDLVPGDFFYFVKSYVEQIKLALTSDKIIQAHVLAELAQERIKEANLLKSKGKVELSEDTLQNAIETQESSLDAVNQTATDGTAVQAPAQVIVPDQVTTTTDTTTTPAPTASPAPTTAPNPANQELAALLQQNIDQLVTALEKVDNPASRNVLVGGIERVFDKFSKSTKQLVQVDLQYQYHVAVIDAELAVGKISADQASQAKTELKTSVDQKSNQIVDNLQKKLTAVQTSVQHKLAAIEQGKLKDDEDEDKEGKKDWKEAQELAKQARKDAFEQAKELKKEAQEKFKEQQKKSAKEHKENKGNGHNKD